MFTFCWNSVVNFFYSLFIWWFYFFCFVLILFALSIIVLWLFDLLRRVMIPLYLSWSIVSGCVVDSVVYFYFFYLWCFLLHFTVIVVFVCYFIFVCAWLLCFLLGCFDLDVACCLCLIWLFVVIRAVWF